MTDSIPSGGDPTQSAPAPEYPPAEQSLQAARKLMGRARGTVKIIRRYVSAGIATWRVEARITMPDGPDYELEVEGDDPDEVSFELVEALTRLGFSVND